MGTPNLDTYLDNLKALLEAVDPNVGKVFLAERRWSSADDLVDDGARIEVGAGGLWDTVEELGPAVRFWILEAWIEPSPLTNCTDEYHAIVNAVGFYGYRENESSAANLRKAAVAIVAQLNLKATELTTLASGMGLGYEGYLEQRARMLSPVRAAQLGGTGHQGHVCQITTGYFEEVARE